MKTESHLPDFSGMIDQLTPLVFDPDHDATGQDNPLIQAYLNHYRMSFQASVPGILHRMGKVAQGDWELAVHYWLPPEPRGSMVIVHGYFDHSGLYGEAVRFALKHNLAVLAYDHPGHGLSTGPRLVIDSFDRYADVLQQLLERSQALLPGPRFALGQSMGGATLLNHLWRHGSALTGRTALLAPLVLPKGWRLSKWLYALLHRWVREIPRVFTDSSHDRDFNHFLAHDDPLQHRQLSVEWVGAMKAWDQQFRRWPLRNDELLIVQGTGDDTVDWQYNLQQIGRRLPRLKVETLSGARHHLVNETDQYREPAFAAVERFFFAD